MATLNSIEYAQQIVSSTKVSVDVIAKLFLAKFSYVQSGTGGATDDFNLIELPAGKITVYPDLSRLVTSAYGGTATTSVGARAYVNSLGVTVAANAIQFANVVSTVSAVDVALTLPAVGKAVFDSQKGFVVSATEAATGIPAAGTMDGWIAFTRG